MEYSKKKIKKYFPKIRNFIIFSFNVKGIETKLGFILQDN